MFDLLLAIGLLGALILLAAFVLNLAGKISHESIPYISMNAFGCVLTAYYALATDSPPFLILEVAWGGFAFYKLLGKFVKR